MGGGEGGRGGGVRNDLNQAGTRIYETRVVVESQASVVDRAFLPSKMIELQGLLEARLDSSANESRE